MESATEYQLKLIRWQFFLTCTWNSSTLGTVGSRETQLSAYLDKWATREGCQLAQLPFAIRWERGESGDRPHGHVLLGGLPARSASRNTVYRQWRLWFNAYGLCACRLYDPATGGGTAALYMSKMRAIASTRNVYELRKTDKADRLVINEKAWRMMCLATGAECSPQAPTALG